MLISGKKNNYNSKGVKRSRIKRFFSLIEVAIGAGIITAGATAAVLLLPIGLRENMDSSGRNFTASAIQTIKAFIQSQITTDTFDGFAKTIPEAYPSKDDLKLNTTIYSSKIHLNCLQEALNKEGFYKISYKTSDNSDKEDFFIAEVIIWRSVNISLTDGYIETEQVSASSDDIKSGGFSNTKDSGTIELNSGAISNLSPSHELEVGDGKTATTLSFENLDPDGSFNFLIEGLNLSFSSDNVKKITLTAKEGTDISFDVDSVDEGKASISKLTGNMTLAVEFNTAQIESDKGEAEITGDKGMTYFFTIDDELSEIGYGLNAEISWPIEKPHMAREKVYYYFEIYKQ